MRNSWTDGGKTSRSVRANRDSVDSALQRVPSAIHEFICHQQTARRKSSFSIIHDCNWSTKKSEILFQSRSISTSSAAAARRISHMLFFTSLSSQLSWWGPARPRRAKLHRYKESTVKQTIRHSVMKIQDFMLEGDSSWGSTIN